MNVFKQAMVLKKDVFIICISLLFLSAAVPSHSSKEVIFIVNSSVQIETISKDVIQQIFIGDKIAWSDTQDIELCILTKSDPLKLFLKTYIDMNSTKFKRHWKKILFTGMGTYPKFFDNEAELIQYVSKTDGAIGFIGALPEEVDVKVITPQ